MLTVIEERSEPLHTAMSFGAFSLQGQFELRNRYDESPAALFGELGLG